MTFRRLHRLRARTTAALLVAVLGATASAESPQSQPPGMVAASPADPVRREARPLRRLTPRTETGAGETARPGGPSAGVLSAVALVALLVVGAAKLWKKHGPATPGALPREAAEVLGRCRIEPRQSLYLVRLGSRILVVGSSGGSLSPLAEITDPVEVDLIAGHCRAGGDVPSFSRLFASKAAREDVGNVASGEHDAEPIPAQSVFSTPSPRPSRRVSPEQRLADRLHGRPSEEADRAA